MGKRAEIISSAFERENYDENLKPFAQSVCKFLNKQLDYLIFLPCSAIVKFDLKSFRGFDLAVNRWCDNTLPLTRIKTAEEFFQCFI